MFDVALDYYLPDGTKLFIEERQAVVNEQTNAIVRGVTTPQTLTLNPALRKRWGDDYHDLLEDHLNTIRRNLPIKDRMKQYDASVQ